jgi:RNA polymerase sigma factor (sigma-70 family)
MNWPESDERLATLSARFASGDETEAWVALTEALELVGGGIAASLRKVGWPSSELDDVMADAVARVFEQRHKVRAIGPYLHRVAHSVAVERWRAQARSRSSSRRRAPQPEILEASFGSSGVAEGRAEETEAARALRAALSDIDAVDQEILSSFAAASDRQDWAGEVAARLGLTPNAVRVRKHRAITRLRERLLGGG